MNATLEQRFNELRLRQYMQWCNEADALLNENNVPEWVLLAGSSAPSNCLPSRLKWFLARRKAIDAREIDRDTKQLNSDMESCKCTI